MRDTPGSWGLRKRKKVSKCQMDCMIVYYGKIHLFGGGGLGGRNALWHHRVSIQFDFDKGEGRNIVKSESVDLLDEKQQLPRNTQLD